MKKYIKPAIENINVENEAIMGFGSLNDKEGYDGGIGGFAKRNDLLFDDEENAE